MYCRNCGVELSSETSVCTQCGVPAGKGSNFCPNCGNAVSPEAVICVKCGTSLGTVESAAPAASNAKSKLAAGLLAIFLGCYGVHNFYLGFTGKAVAQLLLTVLSCGMLSFVSGVWSLVEGIMYLTGSMNVDGKGQKLSD